MSKKRMFVYFDPETTEIKAVSPVELPEEYPGYELAQINYDLGLKFITGEENIHMWYLGLKDGKAKMSRNCFDIPALRRDSYYPIPRIEQTGRRTAIHAAVYLSSNVIEFSIPPQFVGMELENIEEKEMTFFLTKRNDPSHLIAEFKVDIAELFKSGSISCDFDSTYKDFSLFTARVFNHYTFDVKKSRLYRATNGNGVRMNKLVGYKLVDKIPEDFCGLIAIYNADKYKLELRVWNDCAISAPSSQSVLLITRKHDPTVLVDAVNFDLTRLLADHAVKIHLPYDVHQFDFGLAGYPLADEMLLFKYDNGD
jgi:hypothetical protein